VLDNAPNNQTKDGKDKTVHDKINMVVQEIQGEHLINYHAEDFASLFPVWPIIEFVITPSCASKYVQMNQCE
jgi:hypothetical protein